MNETKKKIREIVNGPIIKKEIESEKECELCMSTTEITSCPLCGSYYCPVHLKFHKSFRHKIK